MGKRTAGEEIRVAVIKLGAKELVENGIEILVHRDREPVENGEIVCPEWWKRDTCDSRSNSIKQIQIQEVGSEETRSAGSAYVGIPCAF